MEGPVVHALKPYPSYRESGVPWLGKVPEHWEVRRLRTVAEMRVSNVDKLTNESECAVSLCNYTDVYNNDRIRAGMNFMKATATADEIERFRLRPGDVLITKDSEAWNDIGVPALVESTEDELISGYHLALLRPNSQQIRGAYLHYALSCAGVAIQFHVGANGVTRFGLTQSAIKSVWLPLAPSLEQAAIVHFLHHADRRIRRYIRAKEKLIALLEEQKQVVIHQAVTGQIDVRTGQPYPAYKPSDVELPADVPAHWEFRAAKWYYREVDDRSKTGMEELLSVSHITGVTPRSEKNVTMFKAESNIGYKLCKSDDIVVNTMWAWMAALGVAKQAGIVSPSYAVYRSRHSSNLRGDYANLLLRTTAYRNEYRRRSTGIRSSRLRLYPDEFLRIKFLCPPSEEQQHIVTFVADESKAQRRSIESSRQEIDLLREYRTRLIADVVTGKLDVREVAAALPEEPGDPDAVEADCAEPEGGDDRRPDRERRTAVPATQEEVTP